MVSVLSRSPSLPKVVTGLYSSSMAVL
jgi:hypothetical protein